MAAEVENITIAHEQAKKAGAMITKYVGFHKEWQSLTTDLTRVLRIPSELREGRLSLPALWIQMTLALMSLSFSDIIKKVPIPPKV